MANARYYIAWVKGLTKRREVLRMAEILGADRRYVAACCCEVWEWADAEGTVDEARNVTVRDVTRVTLRDVHDVTGFVEAMIEVGWIVPGDSETTWIFPHLAQYTSSSSKERTSAAARQKRYRDNQRNRDVTCDVTRDVTVTPPEEKRREEIYTGGIPPITPTGTEGSPRPKRKRKAQVAIPYPPEFEDWWLQYPKHRREAKDKAAEAYAAAVNRIVATHPQLDIEQARAFLRQRTVEYAISPAGNKGTYTPMPVSWLNAGRYDDDPQSWNRHDDTHDPRGTLSAAASYLQDRANESQRSLALDAGDRGDVRDLLPSGE